MLVDAFLYNGEADMLALRIATLRDHVDRMVAVTCNLTHQSDPLEPWPVPDGCDLYRVDAKPIPEGQGRGGMGTPWWQWVERQHRNGIRNAVGDVPADTVVLVSDVDEIPDPTTLTQIVEQAQAQPVSVPMRMHGFALNYLYPRTWVATTASTVAQMAPQTHRDWRLKLPKVGAGWHLSWLGDMDEKRRKLRSFCHAELAGLDVEGCYLNGTHANGEPMRRLSACDLEDLDWPAPLFDGFDIPASWWAPED